MQQSLHTSAEQPIIKHRPTIVVRVDWTRKKNGLNILVEKLPEKVLVGWRCLKKFVKYIVENVKKARNWNLLNSFLFKKTKMNVWWLISVEFEAGRASRYVGIKIT